MISPFGDQLPKQRADQGTWRIATAVKRSIIDAAAGRISRKDGIKLTCYRGDQDPKFDEMTKAIFATIYRYPHESPHFSLPPV